MWKSKYRQIDLCTISLNTLLNKYSTVAYLECDIGQCEFTPAGLVSFNLVQQVVIGSPFTHLRTPEKMYFIGETSPKNHPEYYLKCIKLLYEHYRNTYYHQNVPLVINTQGWMKGLGYDMLVHIMQSLQPDLIIYLSAHQNEINNNITTEYGIFDQEKILSTNGINSQRLKKVVHLEPVTLLTPSKYQANDHRQLSLLVYFDKILTNDDSTHLWAQLPYEIDMRKLIYASIRGAMPDHQIGFIFNCSLVGLHVIPSVDTARANSLYILDRMPMVECIGLGLVRQNI